MKSANIKIVLAVVLSSLLWPISAFADNIKWNISSSSFVSGNISGSFIWNNSGSGSIVSNNVVLTVGGVPYNNLVAGDQTSLMSLWASNAVNSQGLFIIKTQLGTFATLSGVAAYIGSCRTTSLGLCNDMIPGFDTGTVNLSGTLLPDAINTKTALTVNGQLVRDAITQRAAAITNTMDYDCNTFDKHNFCLSFQARYTGFESMNDGAGVMTAAYRFDPNYRVGTFVDQRATQGKKTGISYSGDMPTVGAFVGYTQQPNGTGLQAKFVVSGNTGDITATRDVSLSNTEAGSGKSSLNSWAVGGELGWGMMLGNKMIATPYVGLRYTDVTRGSYTEKTTADVTSPLSYASFYQRATTATAGVRIAGMLSDAIGYQLGAGAEYDVGHSANHYSGTSEIIGLETFSVNTNTTTNHFRPSASVGLSYAIDKNQKITTNASLKGQAYSSQPSVTTMAGYQISF